MRVAKRELSRRAQEAERLYRTGKLLLVDGWFASALQSAPTETRATSRSRMLKHPNLTPCRSNRRRRCLEP
jgi:hypothetical protein